MAANHKLTTVIKGRAIKTTSAGADALSITFADGSTMKVKTGAAAQADALKGQTIKGARQSGTTLNLDFTDGSSAQVTLAEATSSVMLRDGKGTMEYAD